METMENNLPSATHQEKAKKMKKLRRWQIAISLLGVAIIVWGVIEVICLFLNYSQTETSNDAQIEQYVSPINLRASGYIDKIYFTEHQEVHKGDTLLVLDDREYKIRVMMRKPVRPSSMLHSILRRQQHLFTMRLLPRLKYVWRNWKKTGNDMRTS